MVVKFGEPLILGIILPFFLFNKRRIHDSAQFVDELPHSVFPESGHTVLEIFQISASFDDLGYRLQVIFRLGRCRGGSFFIRRFVLRLRLFALAGN